MNVININPQSIWQSSFSFNHIKCLIVCRGPIRLETIKIFEEKKIEVVVLAGFMRILTSVFITKYKDRIINIHPSLLPAFPGSQAHKDTIAYGAKISGCTAHLVEEGVDSGPIIMQSTVQIDENETENSDQTSSNDDEDKNK